MLLQLFLIVGLVFGALAGLCGFFITWNEYAKHQFTTQRLFKESFQTFIFVFLFFFILAALIGWLI